MVFKKKGLNFFKTNSDRSRNLLKVTGINYVLVGAKIVIGFLFIPFLLYVLGKERFGIWQTLLSIATMSSVLNFGLGNGLRNFVSQSLVRNNQEIGKVIGSVYLKLLKILVLSGAILIPVTYFFFDPNTLFLNSKVGHQELVISVVLFLFFFHLNTLLSLVDSISFGLHKSYIPNTIQLFYTGLCFFGVWILSIYLTLSLVDITVLFGATLTLIYVLATLFVNTRYKLKINFFKRKNVSSINTLSLFFFLAQALSLLFLAADNFIISSFLGAEETAEYSIVHKVFFTIISIFSILLIQFWNSVTDAYERKDFQWIYNTSKKLSVIAVLFFVGCLTVSFFQGALMRIWLGESIIFQDFSFYVFSTYTFLHCLNAIMVNIQNGIGQLKIQIIGNVLALTLYFILVFKVISIVHYNQLILLKTGLMLIMLIINSMVLKKVKQ